MNTWGRNIKLSIFGESHGPAIGAVIDGLPAGLSLDFALIEKEMARRAPGQSDLTTPRKETDRPEILSGLLEGKTTGFPLCAVIKNENVRSGDYHTNLLRPGHADLTAFYKFKGQADMRGGGHFSGRLTAPLVFAGAIAKQILAEKGVTIGARIKQIHTVCDVPASVKEIVKASAKPFPVVNDEAGERMKQAILDAKAEEDSVGGIVECVALGIPAGFGDPFFESIESVISSMMFSIPAVKGVAFGAGFDLVSMRGSEANDPLYADETGIHAKTNNNGGINGGITNGEPLTFQVAVKPTSTIKKEQTTVDADTMQTVQTKFGGRHDPCIVPRALPVIEAGLALCLLDFMI